MPTNPAPKSWIVRLLLAAPVVFFAVAICGFVAGEIAAGFATLLLVLPAIQLAGLQMLAEERTRNDGEGPQ